MPRCGRVGRSTVSPQHADLAHMSASETCARTRPKNTQLISEALTCFSCFVTNVQTHTAE
ncbi:MAG: hypothetical protein NZ455_12870 [Bacteroidia bacterium]|nr:hypothetical protein [Bacteroidia bacterium]